MKKIVLLTGSELRHQFFRMYLGNSDKIKVVSSYCESQTGNVFDIVKKNNIDNDLRLVHLHERNLVEQDFFKLFCGTTADNSNPIFIKRGDINNSKYVEDIIKLNPDLIVSYGCSIIKSELLDFFKDRFINIHLGLSPYYRGSGTNFWPFVNKELQFIGTTFMKIDEGVDTGEILHQIRARMSANDNIHQIGNRLILDSVKECIRLIIRFNEITSFPKFQNNSKVNKYYKNKDFTVDSLAKAYQNISNGIVKDYLNNKSALDNDYPILSNKSMSN